MSKKRSVGIAAFVIAGIVVLGLAAAVYAKYIASLQASGGAQIAKWNFEDENDEQTVTCNLTSTVVANTIATGTPTIIAPGTSGTCTIALSNTTSEVAVDYTIKANETDSEGIPTNLQLSSDGTTWGSLASFSKSGSLAVGAAATTITIYWQWPYETGTVTDGVAAGDSDDTTDGENAADMSLAFDITGVQHNPANAL